MFSSQANSLDLFYSNPADVFLGSQNGVRLSGESGFNSSHNFHPSNTNSSKEHSQFTNSQDLFSQSQKTDRLDSEVCGMNYQKYISQSRIFGNGGKTQTQYPSSTEKNIPSKFVTDFQADLEQEDIRTSLKTLLDFMSKLSKDMMIIQNSVSKLSENLSEGNSKVLRIENVLEVQSNNFKENFKILKDSSGASKDSLNRLFDVTVENKENILNFSSNLESCLENTTIVKNITKLSKVQETTNKKFLHQLDELNKGLWKMRASIQKFDKDYEDVNEKKWEMLETKFEKKILDQNSFFKESLENLKALVLRQNDKERSQSEKKPAQICSSNSIKKQNIPINYQNKPFQNSFSDVSRYKPLPVMMKINSSAFRNSGCSSNVSTPQNLMRRTPIRGPMCNPTNEVLSALKRKSNQTNDQILKRTQPNNYRSKLRSTSNGNVVKNPPSAKSAQPKMNYCSRILSGVNRNNFTCNKISANLGRETISESDEECLSEVTDENSYYSSPCLTIQEVVSCSKNVIFHNTLSNKINKQVQQMEKEKCSKNFLAPESRHFKQDNSFSRKRYLYEE